MFSSYKQWVRGVFSMFLRMDVQGFPQDVGLTGCEGSPGLNATG